MPLFQSSSTFDADVGRKWWHPCGRKYDHVHEFELQYLKNQLAHEEKATSEYNTAEDWQVIMDICDKIKTTANGPREGLKAIMKRINHRVPHVSMQALTLLSACVNNCDKPFHLEICSREWTQDARRILSTGHSKVADKLKELIQEWAETFKDDPQLNLIPQFFRKLKSEGETFPSSDSSSSVPKIKDEASFKEDLELALALSLQDSDQAKTPSSSLYPSMMSDLLSAQPQKEVRKVRALYDFEAAEDNELTFKAGEIICVLDDSDQNWWKGENHRGMGLFPANFVTSDLSEPAPEESKKEKKKVRFADESERVQTQGARPRPEINEEKMDTCLHMLKNASPTEEDDEEETIRDLEESCKEMSPLIHTKIEESDRRRTDLDNLNEKFLQALALYQKLMKEPVPVPQPAPPPAYSMTQQQYHMQGRQTAYSQPMSLQQPMQQMYNPAQQMYSGPQSLPYLPQGAHPWQSAQMDNGYSSQGPPSVNTQHHQNQQPQQQLQYHPTYHPTYYSMDAQQPVPTQMYTQASVYQ